MVEEYLRKMAQKDEPKKEPDKILNTIDEVIDFIRNKYGTNSDTYKISKHNTNTPWYNAVFICDNNNRVLYCQYGNKHQLIKILDKMDTFIKEQLFDDNITDVNAGISIIKALNLKYGENNYIRQSDTVIYRDCCTYYSDGKYIYKYNNYTYEIIKLDKKDMDPIECELSFPSIFFIIMETIMKIIVVTLKDLLI